MIDEYDKYKDAQMEFVADYHRDLFFCIEKASGVKKGRLYKGRFVRGRTRSLKGKSFSRVEVLNDFRMIETYDTAIFRRVPSDK